MARSLDIRFPAAGVSRRLGQRDTGRLRPPFPTPWAVNVRLQDNMTRRLRGGSRPGLTRLITGAAGTTIADMLSIQVSDDSGTRKDLVVLVDQTIGVVSGGVITFPTGRLITEDGDYIVTEDGDYITVSTTDAPASGFLIAGNQYVYAVNSSSITRIDPKTGTVTLLEANQGSLPTNQTFGAIYRDRMILAGADNAIYMSRQSDYSDWDYGATFEDSARAFILQLSHAALVGPKPTALIPFEDKFLLAASARSLWVVRGDPVAGGQLDEISSHVGIVSSRAWCRHESSVFFLAGDGLYRVAADGSGLESVSGDSLPEGLRDIDTSTTTVLMGYDHKYGGIHLYLVTAGGSDTHYFYELDTKAWWPVWIRDGHAPAAICEYDGNLIVGGTDGYIRVVGGEDDDGSDIVSHVLIGPLKLGQTDTRGLVQSLHGIMAKDSADVTWRIVMGDTAEDAASSGKAAIEAYRAGNNYSGYVKERGMWSEGRSITARPRVEAMWGCLWLQSSGKWAYEGITVAVTLGGKWRAP